MRIDFQSEKYYYECSFCSHLLPLSSNQNPSSQQSSKPKTASKTEIHQNPDKEKSKFAEPYPVDTPRRRTRSSDKDENPKEPVENDHLPKECPKCKKSFIDNKIETKEEKENIIPEAKTVSFINDVGGVSQGKKRTRSGNNKVQKTKSDNAKTRRDSIGKF